MHHATRVEDLKQGQNMAIRVANIWGLIKSRLALFIRLIGSLSWKMTNPWSPTPLHLPLLIPSTNLWETLPLTSQAGALESVGFEQRQQNARPRAEDLVQALCSFEY
jgi:hypothetical protein